MTVRDKGTALVFVLVLVDTSALALVVQQHRWSLLVVELDSDKHFSGKLGEEHVRDWDWRLFSSYLIMNMV